MALNIWKPLLIDRIHMNMSITSNEVYSFAWGQIEAMHEMQKDLLPNGKIKMKKGAYSTRIDYYPNKKLKIAELEIGRRYKNRYLKLSLYPSKFKGEDFLRFKETLDSLLPNFSYAKLFFESRVSYIEIACDLLTQLVHTFIPFRPKTNHSYVFIDNTGAKGATYLGSRTSSLRFCIYDKAKHLTDTKIVSPHKLHTRIEARLKKLALAPSELLKMHNPFQGLWMADINQAYVISKDPHWLVFLDACANAGSPTALASLTKNNRKCFMDRLFAARANWWKPESRWTGLAAALKQIAP